MHIGTFGEKQDYRTYYLSIANKISNGLIKNNHNVINFGVKGSSNEFICREIIKHSKTNDIVVVMWTGFDRVHSETYLQERGYNMGQNPEYCIGTSLEQLYQRTLEYIWLANQFCKENNIKIINLLMTILELGETQQTNKFSKHLDIDTHQWPIDFSSFCIDNKNSIPNQSVLHPFLVQHNENGVVEIFEDKHPLPSQHYYFHKEIICPALNLQPYLIDDKHLGILDKKATKKNYG